MKNNQVTEPSMAEIRRRIKRRPFAYIALWQLLVFVLLICLIWVCELFDLPSLYFGDGSAERSFFQGWILTAGVLICAIIMIGNTYVQQKHIIKGLIIVCSYCNRIKIEKDVWEEIQQYLSKHSLVAFSHGMCPDCAKKFEKSFDEA